MIIKEIRVKNIFTKTRIPGAKYVINQYVGCQYGCPYCYAKFLCRWKGLGEWGEWIEVKINAPDLVKGRLPDGRVYMSSVSDPYQPIELRYELTRKILRNMDRRVELSILTKSPLILRDLDLIRGFQGVEVGLTINGLDGKAKRLLEPRTPRHDARVEALRKIKLEGVRTYGFISPVIPKIVDVFDLIEETRTYVDYYLIELLNLRASGKKFLEILRENFSDSYKILKEDLDEFIEELSDFLIRSGVTAELITHRRGLTATSFP